MKSIINNIIDQIKSLVKKLGNVPTILYLFGYLLVIFVFSLIYYFALPGKHFYHSTSLYEDEFFNKDVDEILQEIQDQLVSNYIESVDENLELDGWRIDTDELKTNSLFVGNFPSEFSFQVTIPFFHPNQEVDDFKLYLPVTVTLNTDHRIRIDDTVYLFFKIEDLSNLPQTEFPDPRTLFTFRLFNQQLTTQVFPMSYGLYNKIIGIGKGYRGFPSNVSGQYGRMLYLSTGIATSCVFGDIVPVSTQARLLVTIEGLLSVIFVGLFLNGLAYDIGEVLKQNSNFVYGNNKKRISKRSPNI